MPAVSQAVASGVSRAVQLPNFGNRKATSTSEIYIDLSAYTGRFVVVTCETGAHFVCAHSAASGTIVTGNTTSPAFADLVGERFAEGEKIQGVVSGLKPFLVVRTVTGSGSITVHVR